MEKRMHRKETFRGRTRKKRTDQPKTTQKRPKKKQEDVGGKRKRALLT
jgi:hypothetical protein